jgi:hypothetical protein
LLLYFDLSGKDGVTIEVEGDEVVPGPLQLGIVNHPKQPLPDFIPEDHCVGPLGVITIGGKEKVARVSPVCPLCSRDFPGEGDLGITDGADCLGEYNWKRGVLTLKGLFLPNSAQSM